MGVKLVSASGGSVELVAPATATNYTATMPANTGTVITTASTFAGTGPAFSTQFSGTSVYAATQTELTSNIEVFDTANCLAQTGRFTPNVAGYYQVNTSISAGAASGVGGLAVTIRKNSADTVNVFAFGVADTTEYKQGATAGLVYLNGTTDYVSVYGYCASGSYTATGFFSGSLVRAA